MRPFSLTLILLFTYFFSFSQDLESVEKIKFFYSIGGSSWGKNRVFSKSEIFELTKNENNDFIFNKYLKINNKVRNRKISKDTIEITEEAKSIVSKIEIKNLLNELNTNRDNFTSKFLIQNFAKPTKKEIYKIAKQNDQKNLFSNNYEENADFENRYLDIQNYKNIELFVNSYKPTQEHLVYIDSWHFLRIFIYQKESIKMYEFTFYQNLGQRFSIVNIESIDENSNKVNITDYTETLITNLNLNNLIRKMFPEKTMIANILDLNRIRDQYIKWYLKNLNGEEIK